MLSFGVSMDHGHEKTRIAGDAATVRGSDPIERWMAECLELPPHRWDEAVRVLCAEHPQYADELRRRMQFVTSFGLSETSGIPERLGDFRLLERLGSGGMGVVYIAEQVSLGRTVALKLIRPEAMYFDGARERFRREAEAVARLQHPGIVPIYTFGEERGIPYFAMERVEGVSVGDLLESFAGRDPGELRGSDLQHAIARSLQCDPDEVATFDGSWSDICFSLVAQVAAALEHAHSRDVLHRDVKPGNILIARDGRALLLDFGLALLTRTSRLTRTGAPLGSILYMSPEQLDPGDRQPDERTDLYSLGVTLYELLTLQPPYKADAIAVAQRLILHGEASPVRSLNPRVGIDGQTVCHKAMERDSERRYASATDFARDLDNVLARRPIEARPPGAVTRALRYFQRRPAAAVGLLLAFVSLFVLPTALLVQAHLNSGRLAEALTHEEAARAEADKQREEAERELATSEQVTGFLVDLFRASDPFDPEYSDLTARELLARGAERIPEYEVENPRIQGALHLALGQVFVNLGDAASARPLAEEGARLWTRDFDPEDDDRAARRVLHARLLLASVYTGTGESARAEALYRDAIDIATGRFGANSAEAGSAHASLGYHMRVRRRYTEANEAYEESLAILAADDETTPLRKAGLKAELASALFMTMQCTRALQLYDEALAVESAELGHDNPQLISRFTDMGLARRFMRDFPGAAELYNRALEIAVKHLGPVSSAAGSLRSNLGVVYSELGDHEAAAAQYDEAVLILERTLTPQHENCLHASIAQAANRIDRGLFAEAAEMLLPILPRAAETWGEESVELAVQRWRLAHCLHELGMDDEARAALAPAMPALQGGGPVPTDSVPAVESRRLHAILHGTIE